VTMESLSEVSVGPPSPPLPEVAIQQLTLEIPHEPYTQPLSSSTGCEESIFRDSLEFSSDLSNESQSQKKKKKKKTTKSKRTKTKQKLMRKQSISTLETVSVDTLFGTVSSAETQLLRQTAHALHLRSDTNKFTQHFDWLWTTDYNFEVYNYTRCIAQIILSSTEVNTENLSLSGGTTFGMQVGFNHQQKTSEKILDKINGSSEAHHYVIPVRTNMCYLTVLLIKPEEFYQHRNDPSKWAHSVTNMQVNTSKYGRYNILRDEEFLVGGIKEWK
jgi:hypothetical protein